MAQVHTMAPADLVGWTAAVMGRGHGPAAWVCAWAQAAAGGTDPEAAWVERELPLRLACRCPDPYLLPDEAARLARWALGPAGGRAARRLEQADPALVQEATRLSLGQPDNPEGALASLLALPGCGPRLAAAVLAACRPAEFGALPPGWRLCRSAAPATYGAYTRFLRLQARALAAATGFGWTPAMVAQALAVLARPA